MMSFALPNLSPSYKTNAVLTGPHSFGASAKDAFNDTIPKIKEALTSPLAQEMFGFGLGVGLGLGFYRPLTGKIIKALGISTVPLTDPFRGLGLGCLTLLSHFMCVIYPMMYERQFRGDLQGTLKDKLNAFYLNRGFSASNANISSRLTSIFFTSIISNLIYVPLGMMIWGIPPLFLPILVADTLMGLIYGLAKEFSGELHLPIGMHMGFNTLVWTNYLKQS